MRFIPTMLHGVADYLVGILVVGLPLFLGLHDTPRAVLVALGIIVILYSLATDYELGAVRFLKIRFHLLLDALFGVAMLVSPCYSIFQPQAVCRSTSSAFLLSPSQ
jgi:hypothetical protein